MVMFNKKDILAIYMSVKYTSLSHTPFVMSKNWTMKINAQF